MMGDEIDPQLPYIQVYRNVAQLAAALAPLVSVTNQHALGALVTFWQGLADRRLLAGKTELVLGADDVRTRLLIAFGKEVEPRFLVALGFLERRGDGFRIRGASRMLNVEAGRLKKKTGVGSGSNPGLVLVAPESDPRSDPGPTPVASGSDPTEVRGKRQEEKDESLENRGKAPPPLVRKIEKPTHDESRWSSRDFWAWAQAKRGEEGHTPEPEPKSLKLGAFWSSAFECVPHGPPNVNRVAFVVAGLKRAFVAFGNDSHWLSEGIPFNAFMAQWSHFIPPVEAARAT